MENYNKNIELIDNYINKTLSKQEVDDFENRLKIDNSFKTVYEDHLILLEGIKRQQLKLEIALARKVFIRNIWLKYFGLSVVIGGIVFMGLSLLKNKPENPLLNKVNFESEYVQDFIVSNDSLVTVFGKKGTEIRFNPNDLETLNGKPINGDSLNVELIELTTKQDLLYANTQTISHKKWLISGGAFKIDIKSGEDLLVLKEGKTIDVVFPKNSDISDMELFYGERDNFGNMNWDSTGNFFKSHPYVILTVETSVIDTILTKRYGGVETHKSVNVVDTIGHLGLDEVKNQFNDVKFFDTSLDTLIIYRKHVYDSEIESPAVQPDSVDYKIDELLPNEEAPYEIAFEQITKQEFQGMESVISKANYFNILRQQKLYFKKIDHQYRTMENVYKTIQLSTLGWINIDSFAKDEVKINITLDYSITTDFNQVYIVDERNNTILNIYDNEADLPINRSFYILSIGIKGKDIYGFKKSVRFNKSGSFKVDYRKINESQIKEMLTLPFSSKSSNNIVDTRKTVVTQASDSIQKTNQTQKIKKPEVLVKEKASVLGGFKASQNFSINSKKDTIIVCSEGTKLVIKANSFVNQNNEVVTGTINVKVEEYYKLSDILLANLTTQSDGKLLETGGMLHLKVLQGEELLKLKPNSPVEIMFSEQNKKEGMQLFSGEWKDGNINWEPLSNSVATADMPVENIIIEEPDIEIEVPFAVVEEVPVYPGCENGNNLEKKECMKDAVERHIRRKLNTEIAKDIGLTGRQRIQAVFKINQKGEVVSIRTRAAHPELEREAKRVIGLLPKMKPGIQRGKAVTVPYSLPIIFQVEGTSGSTANSSSPIVNRREQNSLYTKRIEQKLIGKDSTKVKAIEVSSYIFRTSKLGWINCDRFRRFDEKIKYRLKVKNGEEVARIHMVFKSMNSVLPSWKSGEEFDFRMVPKNEDIVLIAIKKDEGKLFLDIVQTKTEVNPIIEFNFKEITLESLKNELKKLNSMF